MYSSPFWRAYVVHMRPYLLFVSGAAGLAGIAVAPVTMLSWQWVLPAFLPLFLSYGFGQALTDCFQVDTDRLSAPYRPLSQGIVTIRSVGIVSLAGLIAGVGLLVALNLWNILPGALSIAGLATYTFFKRRFWWAGPLYNAWIVALLPFIGYLAATRSGLPEQNSTLYSILALSLFSYTNFVLMGYLKDISADRATGYRTFPVVFGWNPTVWAGDVLVLISAILGGVLVFPSARSGSVWGVATLVAVSGQVYAHLTKDKTENNAAFSITATVRSFILWHLAVILMFRGNWWPGLLAYYLLFEWVLWKRPSAAQV